MTIDLYDESQKSQIVIVSKLIFTAATKMPVHGVLF